jgi:hypothetical protein
MFDGLRRIFERAAKLRSEERLSILPMREVVAPA